MWNFTFCACVHMCGNICGSSKCLSSLFLIHHSIIFLFPFVCMWIVCVNAAAHMLQHLCEGQRKAWRLQPWLAGLRTSGDSPVTACHLSIIPLELGMWLPQLYVSLCGFMRVKEAHNCDPLNFQQGFYLLSLLSTLFLKKGLSLSQETDCSS